MLEIMFIWKNEKERTSAALEISKPVDVRRLSACALVAGGCVLRVLKGNSLAISTTFTMPGTAAYGIHTISACLTTAYKIFMSDFVSY